MESTKERVGTDSQWESFCRLGEMIGDGLHHEDTWILKEYKSLQKILIPETEAEKEYKRKITKSRNENVNQQLLVRLKTDRCQCGGSMKQTRSGSKKVKCTVNGCGKRYTYKSK